MRECAALLCMRACDIYIPLLIKYAFSCTNFNETMNANVSASCSGLLQANSKETNAVLVHAYNCMVVWCGVFVCLWCGVVWCVWYGCMCECAALLCMRECAALLCMRACDIYIPLLIRRDKLPSKDGPPQTAQGLSALPTDHASTLLTAQMPSPQTPQASAPPSVLVCTDEAASGSAPPSVQVCTAPGSAPLAVQVCTAPGSAPASVQVCTVEAAPGSTPPLVQVCTAPGSAPPSVQVCTAPGSAPPSTQMPTVEVAQGTALQTTLKCTLETAWALAQETGHKSISLPDEDQ